MAFDDLLNPSLVISIASLAVTGLAFAIQAVQFAVQREKKSLSLEILSESPLFKKHDELESRLQIFFDQKPIEDADLVLIGVANDGNVSIDPSDFQRR